MLIAGMFKLNHYMRQQQMSLVSHNLPVPTSAPRKYQMICYSICTLLEINIAMICLKLVGGGGAKLVLT